MLVSNPLILAQYPPTLAHQPHPEKSTEETLLLIPLTLQILSPSQKVKVRFTLLFFIGHLLLFAVNYFSNTD
jgi:hypothetical protein